MVFILICISWLRMMSCYKGFDMLPFLNLQEFIEVVKNFEAVQKKWLHAELELKKHKELLVKSDVARSALEVKLKHARNQLDVEIKKRYKAEADYQCLVSKLPCFNTNFYQQTNFDCSGVRTC